MRAHNPVRTCIGCRKTQERNTLVRLVLDGSADTRSVVIDEHRSMPGRGAWLHPHTACFDIALSRGSLNRAFKTRVEVSGLRERFETVITRRPTSSVSGDHKTEYESGSEI